MRPEAAMLFQADSPAWSQSRYYQDAAIRAAFEKICCDRSRQAAARAAVAGHRRGKDDHRHEPALAPLTSGRLPKPALVPVRPGRAARAGLQQAQGRIRRQRPHRQDRTRSATRPANARIHIATYQTLGLETTRRGSPASSPTHYARRCLFGHHHRRVPPFGLGPLV